MKNILIKTLLLSGVYLGMATSSFAQLEEPPHTILVNGTASEITTVLQKYISIPSISGQEQEAGLFLQMICEENGLHITRMGQTNGNFNFAASIYPLESNLPNIVFLNHIDVVPAGDTLVWDYPAFSGALVDQEIWGRGAFDNKGVAVTQLFAVLDFAERYAKGILPFNVTFLAVSCEETQCSGGVEYVVANYLDQLHAEVVLGEGPSGLTGIVSHNSELPVFGISVAHKRSLWLRLDLSVEGVRHGSVTPLRYAGREMVEALERLLSKRRHVVYTKLNTDVLRQLGGLEKGIKAVALKHPRFFRPLLVPQLRKQPELLAIFTNTATLTRLESGENPINAIPSNVTAWLDCRLLPHTDQEVFIQDLAHRLNHPDIKISIELAMPEQQISDHQSPYFQYLASAIKTQYEEAEVVHMLVPYANDSGVFRHQGITAYSSVPTLIDRKYLETVHGHNERIPVVMLAKTKATYVRFLENCAHDFDEHK